MLCLCPSSGHCRKQFKVKKNCQTLSSPAGSQTGEESAAEPFLKLPAYIYQPAHMISTGTVNTHSTVVKIIAALQDVTSIPF